LRLIGIPCSRQVAKKSGQPTANDEIRINFSDHSYGFRPKKNMQQALLQSLAYINEGYSDIVEIDLSKFFDEEAHIR